MEKTKGIGSTDRPVFDSAEDAFQVEPYITGLGEFVLECQTPMTVAIQGAWGSGKTSTMYMVRQYLEKKGNVKTIWFNTWQFSQFNMDAQIATTFLQHFIKALDADFDNDKGKVARKVGQEAQDILKKVIVGATRHFAGDEIGEIVQDKMTASEDMADEIEGLKNKFTELLEKVTQGDDSRVVIFVDDLDRLQPKHAVELLEVLKIFVDCESCIFMLAIDTSVVFQGIREKYGQDISDEKAQSFFDKIIQLPFKMPVVNYRLDDMVRDMLRLDERQVTPEDEREYMRLVRLVSDGNPRSIKRLVNFYLLTDKVTESKKIYDGMTPEDRALSKKIIFAVSCIQLKYERLYEFILKDISLQSVKRIWDMKLPELNNENRAEVMIDALKKIKAPDYTGDIVERNAYADVAIICFKNCQRFLTKNPSGVEKRMRELIGLLRMSKVIDVSGEKTYDESGVEPQESIERTDTAAVLGTPRNICLDFNPLRLVTEGKGMEALEGFYKRDIYPRIGSNIGGNAGDFGDVRLKEYKNRSLDKAAERQIAEHPLGGGLIDRLSEIYIVEKKSSGVYIRINGYGEGRFLCISMDHEMKLQVQIQNAAQKLLAGDDTCLGKYLAMMEKQKEIYRALQAAYGSMIFPDRDFFQGVQDRFEGDKKVGYEDIHKDAPAIYLVNREMLDCFVNFAVDVSTYLEKASGEAGKNSGAAAVLGGLADMLKGAEGGGRQV